MAGLDPAIRVPDTALIGAGKGVTDLRHPMIPESEASVPVAEQHRKAPPENATEDLRVDGRPAETGRTSDDVDSAVWSWFGFWLQMLVLAVLVVIGAFFASAAQRSGDYACGMLLSLGTIALAFLRLKHRLDGRDPGLMDLLLVDDMWNLSLVIPLFTVIGLAGLFTAQAAESGALHTAGVMLFVISGAIIFLDMKRVFDRIDASGRR
jgi:hypothetical protein